MTWRSTIAEVLGPTDIFVAYTGVGQDEIMGTGDCLECFLTTHIQNRVMVHAGPKSGYGISVMEAIYDNIANTALSS